MAAMINRAQSSTENTKRQVEEFRQDDEARDRMAGESPASTELKEHNQPKLVLERYARKNISVSLGIALISLGIFTYLLSKRTLS